MRAVLMMRAHLKLLAINTDLVEKLDLDACMVEDNPDEDDLKQMADIEADEAKARSPKLVREIDNHNEQPDFEREKS
jgi:hypothetical protein